MRFVWMIDDISTKNKYHRWWRDIIVRGMARGNRQSAKKALGYVEGHHIYPISFGAERYGEPENVVYLSAKEHIMVHRLMCHFLTGVHRTKSLRAFHSMCNQTNGGRNKRRPSVHHLAKARESARIANSVKRGISGTPKWFTPSNDFSVFVATIQAHVDEGTSDPEIGNLYGVSATAIHAWRKKLCISSRRNELRNPEYLFHHYINLKKSASQIANDLGCTSTAVQQYLNKFGIPIRSAHERQRLRADRQIPSGEIIPSK